MLEAAAKALARTIPLETIAPHGGAIYLRRIPVGDPSCPQGGVAYKIRTGVDFEAPDAVEPKEATVSVILDILQAMRVPGTEQYSMMHVIKFAPYEGVGLLLKRNPLNGQWVIKLQSPCPFDSPDAIAPEHASITDLVGWIKAVTRPGEA